MVGKAIDKTMVTAFVTIFGFMAGFLLVMLVMVGINTFFDTDLSVPQISLGDDNRRIHIRSPDRSPGGWPWMAQYNDGLYYATNHCLYLVDLVQGTAKSLASDGSDQSCDGDGLSPAPWDGREIR